MISKSNVMLLVLAMGLVTGCDGKKDPVDSASGNASPNALISSPKLSDPPTAAAASAPSLPRPDLTVPVSSYFDLNAEPAGMALTYVVVAKTQGSLSDEDKLNQLSPEYYNEADAFKKRDLAKAELPQINTQIEQYRKNNYYSLPIAAYSQKPLGFTSLTVGAYDLKTQSFPLVRYGQYCFGGSIRNQQGATLQILQSDFACSVRVDDEAQARTIEAARTQGALAVQGTLYLFVPVASAGTASAIVSHAHLEFINTQTKSQLASFDL